MILVLHGSRRGFLNCAVRYPALVTMRTMSGHFSCCRVKRVSLFRIEGLVFAHRLITAFRIIKFGNAVDASIDQTCNLL
jgi:hypothetical protein